MGPSHPVRHQLRILLVCLFALLLAREAGYRFPPIHSSQPPPIGAQAHIKPPALKPRERLSFPYQMAATRGYDLQPFFSYLDRAGLGCCQSDPSGSNHGTTISAPDLNSTLNPNTFPQAEQFLRKPTDGSAISNPEEKAEVAGAYAGFTAGAPLGAVPVLLPNCSSHAEECETSPQDSDPGVKIPEPGSLMLALSGLSTISIVRFLRR